MLRKVSLPIYEGLNLCNLPCCSLLIKIYSLHAWWCFTLLLSYISGAGAIWKVHFYIYLDTKTFYNNMKVFNINTSKQVCFFRKACFLSGRSAALQKNISKYTILLITINWWIQCKRFIWYVINSCLFLKAL